ncbi:MAG: peptidyl-prolyl cis-trans isomerase [Gemmatimonadota bacterium]
MRTSAKWIWLFIVICFVGVFLFAETSGLLGVGPSQITTSTAVAEVNGVDVPYVTWANVSNQLAQQEERNSGRSLSLDERRRVEDQAFEQLVSNILLEQEYKRRDITVSDQEIIEASQQSPPPELMQSPDFQTDGRFDIAKYRRFIGSAAARSQGVLVQLENYYRQEIPRAKLFDQLAGDVFVSDAKLWNVYRDLNDSAQVSFVKFDASAVPDSAVTIPESELRSYYDKHKAQLERPGRAVVSVISVPRTISAADTQATQQRMMTLRNEIVGGAKFEDVARRESSDTVSGTDGGSLGTGGKGRFAKDFEDAAYGLKVGEVSQPVLTQFGYHLIKVDARKGDTLTMRHILLRIQQSDSSASRSDRLADSLSRMAATQESPAKFDSAAKTLSLPTFTAVAIEGEPLMANDGRSIPSVSAWAFGGAKVGETSDLFDSDQGYFVARLDSMQEGGVPSFDNAKGDIRRQLISRKKAESLVPKAEALAKAAASSTLETAASAAGMTPTRTDMFSRPQFVAGLGRFNAAVGAAFSLPLGQVSAPIVTDDGVFVLRVEHRVDADKAKWEAQKETQRREAVSSIQQLRVRTFLSEIRKQAKVEDHRKQLNSLARQQTS